MSKEKNKHSNNLILHNKFNSDNIKIVICIIVIMISVIIIIKPELVYNPIRDIWPISLVENNKPVTKEEALELAKSKFDQIGNSVDLNDLHVEKIKREDKSYYYIASIKSTIEISVDTGDIVRINGEQIK